eukprot:12594395-Heterocapsa_arctica.AAC.1
MSCPARRFLLEAIARGSWSMASRSCCSRPARFRCRSATSARFRRRCGAHVVFKIAFLGTLVALAQCLPLGHAASRRPSSSPWS